MEVTHVCFVICSFADCPAVDGIFREMCLPGSLLCIKKYHHTYPLSVDLPV